MAWFFKSSGQRMTRLHLEALHLRVTLLEKRMAQIDDLKTKVEAQDTVIQSAVTLLNGLKDRLAGVASGDAQKVQGLMQDLDNNTTALAQAVAAGTAASAETTAAQPGAPQQDPAVQQSPSTPTQNATSGNAP